MSTTIKNPITGKDKAIITDNCIYSTITGRKIAYVENGEIISVLTGKPISVVATDSNGESIDLTNLVAGNIKSGVTINGVTGTFTNGATATAQDILAGKTAWGNGKEIVGELEQNSGGAEKVYLYTITGQSPESTAPIINGDYYEVTGDDIPKGIQALGTPMNYPVCTNGFGSFLFVYDSYGTGNSYNIGFAFGEQSHQVTYLYIKSSDGLNPIGGSSDYWMLSGIGWSGTVKEYASTGGGGTGDNTGGGTGGGEATTVNISGAIQSRFDGDYIYNASNSRYEQSNSVMWTRYIEWVASRYAWCIVEDQGGYYGYTDLGGTQGDITSIAGTKSVMINGEPIDSCTITITVSGGSNSGGGSGSSADYIVSGATSYPDVNGEYNESGTANGKPKYVNTVNSNAYIQCDNILGWAVFYYSQPRYYTNDTSSATPPISATWQQGNEIITVTKG